MDFQLYGQNSLTIKSEGCNWSPADAPNQLLVDIHDQDNFEIKILGFDPHRDLYVRMDPIEEETEVEESDENDS